jgi:hypothetical protein
MPGRGVRRRTPLLLIALFLAMFFILPPAYSVSAQEIGQWKRFTVTLSDPTTTGNPYDLKFEGRFRHTESGRTMTVPGFHAGGSTWKIFFMPDQTGEWTYSTSSADADLNGKQGGFTCVASDLPGLLQPDGKWWRLGGTGYDLPVILPVGDWLKAKRTDEEIARFVTWASEVAGARAIGLTLTYFNRSQDVVPYVKGKEGQTFNTGYWDRLNRLFDAARDAGMGHYIRFYSDDAEAPSRNKIGSKSTEEKRLLTYAIARFSAYPVVIWDTGIDIVETRPTDWPEWFCKWMLANDPWKHPVGNRSGGGSGSSNPPSATYYADGADTLPSRNGFVKTWKGRKIPTAMTDNWREDYSRGNFNRARIRRAVWEMGLTGGTGLMISGNEFSGYLGATYASDLKAAPDVGHAVRFLTTRVGDLRRLAPHDELVQSGSSVSLAADPGREYVAYLPTGGRVDIDLKSAPGSFLVHRFDPLKGEISTPEMITGGRIVTIDVPSGRETVLHITPDALPDEPKILSSPVSSARVGETYSYHVDAPDSPDVSFRLVHGPVGMSIDGQSGIITWVPTDQGSFDVEVAAENNQGADTQTFTITVNAAVSTDDPDDIGNTPDSPVDPGGSTDPDPVNTGSGGGGGGGCAMDPGTPLGIEWLIGAAALVGWNVFRRITLLKN